MKKFWKRTLRLATLATVIPVSVTHDEENGKTTYQSLLASLELGPGQEVGINLGEGVLTGAIRGRMAAQKEESMFDDQALMASSPVVQASVETAQEAPASAAPQDSSPAEDETTHSALY